MNIQQARNNLEAMIDDRYGKTAEYWELKVFIDEVEALLKHNSIKQVPALFKEKR